MQEGCDVILHPTTISTAPLKDSSTEGQDEYAQDVLNVPASLAGLPAISIPAGKGTDGWPLGVQMAGQWGTDLHVLRIAKAIEDVLRTS